MSIPRTIVKSLWAVIASLLMLAAVGSAQSQPFAYITGQNGSIVSVLDTATNAVVTTIPVGGAPFGIGILPNGSRAYVANSTPNTVSVINLATNTVVATIALDLDRWRGCQSRWHARLCGEPDIQPVSVIDTSTNGVISTVPLSRAYVIAINPAGTRLFVTNPGINSVTIIDTTTNTVTGSIGLTGGPGSFGVAFNPSGTRAYVANEFGPAELFVIDTSTNTIITSVAVGRARAVSRSIPPARVYTANGSSDNVSVVDTVTNTVTHSIPVGSSPRSVTFKASGTRAYVGNVGSNTVSVIDTGTETVIATVPVTQGPFGIAIASAAPPVTVTVTPSAGANGTINPATPQSIVSGATTNFTVTPAVGYAAAVGGTCGGTLVGNTYTTAAITVPCTVSATFSLIPPATFLLTVSSTGAGSVTSSPAGIVCPGDCTEAYSSGTTVTLTASANAGSTFLGWGGACGGTGGCSVAMNAIQSVTASFSAPPAAGLILTSSSNPAIYRSSVVLTASATGNTPTGTVTFNMATSGGPLTLCAAVPMVSARAKCPVPAPLIVTSPSFFSATYSGDSNNPGANASLQQLIITGSVGLT
ncbi:MAG: YncE family protein [Betaproteobacteria bacterium]|nr:YncE family protein [Betaproteobacteria bacterium]